VRLLDRFNVDPNQHTLSRWPIVVFLISATICLTCSAIFHLFYAISHKAYSVLLRLDYAGVSILISGSTFPLSYYGFYCEPVYAAINISLVGTACLVVFFVSL